ncbi:MAG: hypothetical protein IT245_00025, partial [Bacteroidia bacterium]|nr:hypothetical protein [Bacteroidia bacterium]
MFLVTLATGVILENTNFSKGFVFKDANSYLQRKLEKKAEVQKHILEHEDLIAMLEHFDVESELYREIRSNHLTVFAYKHKCLSFWMDNQTHTYNFPINTDFELRYGYNENGWVQIVSIRKGDYDIYCFYKLYEHYPLNNEYFVNAFASDLNLKDIRIV